MGVREFTENNILILDGAMGTMLQDISLIGENPVLLNLSKPEKITDVHRLYINAGSNMILTNTFCANSRKLAGSGYSVAEVIAAAVNNAKKAAEGKGFIALDIGPIGELFEPMGTLSFDEAYEIFKEQILCGAKEGVDAIFIETMTDLYEAKCAVLAAKENCHLPVFCTMSFEENMRTFLGTSISSAALTLEGLGVDYIGFNCSVGPKQMIGMVEELLKYTNLPIIVKPNAGLPQNVDGKEVFNADENEFAEQMEIILKSGAGVVGGCCGTNPKYIEKLKKTTENLKLVRREKITLSAVCSHSKTVVIDRVRIIGERINPTGKKLFKQALIDGNTDYIIRQAIEQAEAGADILDVNVGVPNIDEKATMVEVVKNIQSVLDLPLQIDSSSVEAIEAGLRAYNGKAIVNSVNGEDSSLHTVLPIVKKYGAAIVGLTLDSTGIPKTAEERLEIARKIVDTALEYKIPKQDIIIDCLTLTSGAEQEIAYETVKALALIKEKLGVKTALGVSNISFGLPMREKLNQVFLGLALANGLDLPIINPNVKEMTDTVFCYHQLKNIDRGSNDYINRFSNAAASAEKSPADKPKQDLSYLIQSGLKDEVKTAVKAVLDEKEPMTIVNEILIPALDKVGQRYEKGEIFLPQLLQSAEAAKQAFEVLKSRIPENAAGDMGTVLVATVEGDIHDIGKNIVKVVLENYGYKVIDLGKDVKIQRVAEETIKHKVKLVGLSALMTTTLGNMEKTIQSLKEASPDTKIMVGGAVLTGDYAQKIGADYYVKDAMASVAVARELFG